MRAGRVSLCRCTDLFAPLPIRPCFPSMCRRSWLVQLAVSTISSWLLQLAALFSQHCRGVEGSGEGIDRVDSCVVARSIWFLFSFSFASGYPKPQDGLLAIVPNTATHGPCQPYTGVNELLIGRIANHGELRPQILATRGTREVPPHSLSVLAISKGGRATEGAPRRGRRNWSPGGDGRTPIRVGYSGTIWRADKSRVSRDGHGEVPPITKIPSEVPYYRRAGVDINSR